MLGYVWGLHDFVPENPDEVPFKIGERIEVIERDDLYQDGWWQGRNTSGRIGLFPKAYASDKPPSSSALSFPSSSATLPTTTDTSSNATGSSLSNTAQVPEPPVQSTNVSGAGDERERTLSQGERVMKATISDVQKAIEQLGKNDRDGAQSFSFASSRGESTDRSETETDHSDDDGQDWHKSAREKLAERAKRENEERKAKEAAEQAQPNMYRSVAPPIDVELSEESEEDEDHHFHHHTSSHRLTDPHVRSYSQIPEEDEDEHEDIPISKNPAITSLLRGLASHSRSNSASSTPHLGVTIPSPIDHDESDLPTASASKTSFPPASLSMPPQIQSRLSSVPSIDAITPTSYSPQVVDITPHPAQSRLPITTATPPPPPSPRPLPRPPPPTTSNSAPTFAPTPTSIAILSPTRLPIPPPSLTPPSYTPAQTPAPPPTARKLPSASNKFAELPFTNPSTLSSPTGSSFSSNPPTFPAPQTVTPATTVTSFKTASVITPPQEGRASTPGSSRGPLSNPSEWGVDEVVDWLKSKGFDDGVCSKFTEQEITGDVLLELDANVLKSEIGITAFGKRIRIVNAIEQLRRPPSPEKPPAVTSLIQAASRAQSVNYGHSHTPSMQSSANQSFSNSPLPVNSAQFSPLSTADSSIFASSAPPLSAGVGSIMSMDSMLPQQSEDTRGRPDVRNGWRTSDPGSRQSSGEHSRGKDLSSLGLGFPSYPPSTSSFITTQQPSTTFTVKDRHSLFTSTTSNPSQKSPPGTPSPPEDRGVMSDSETAPASEKVKRRRFWRSNETSSLKEKASSLKDSSSRHSRDFTTPTISAPMPLGAIGSEDALPVKRQNKRPGSEEKKQDRMSIFGSSFSSNIIKQRKPAPRVSSVERPEPKHEKSSSLSTFSRLRLPERSSNRPGTAETSPKEREKIRELSPIRGSLDHSTSVLRKRNTISPVVPNAPRPVAATIESTQSQPGDSPVLKSGKSLLDQIGTPDHSGWMRKKGERYNTWKLRYFVLKGPHLYWLKSDTPTDGKVKGYLNIQGYKVETDETVDPGRFGFQIVHDHDKTHYFSHEEHSVVREWMKALMKATITRDYTAPVMSSSNIPTIPLAVAQAMSPAPRPPSPTAREATQRAYRRDNPNQLSSRDAQVLMSLPGKEKSSGTALLLDRPRIESFFESDTATNGHDMPARKVSKSSIPPRPMRETRRKDSSQSDFVPVDASLLEWANSHLPEPLQMTDPTGPICGGLALLRIAEDIKGRASSPPVPDTAFPRGPDDEKADGLFRLFDFLLDNDVKMGTISINDIRQGRRDKIVQLLRSLKAWEEKRKAVAQSIGKMIPSSAPFAIGHVDLRL